MESSPARIALAAVLGAALIGCTGNLNGKDADAGTDTGTEPPLEPYTVTFDLQNDGAGSVYLYEGCLLELTITDLADPTHTIGRIGGCGVCDCAAASCPAVTCGACYMGGMEVIAGGKVSYAWGAIDEITGSRGATSCVTTRVLPAGHYRIDVPVYTSSDDAINRASARRASQSFDLPPTGDVVVPLGVHPTTY